MKRALADHNSFEDLATPCKIREVDDLDLEKSDATKEDAISNLEERIFTEEYIDDNIEVINCLGSGSYGTVHLVRDKKRGDYLAMKETSSKKTKFDKEVSMLRRAQGSEYIIEMKGHCAVVDKGRYYLFMENFEGCNLKEYSRERTLEPTEIRSILYQFGCAIKHVHQKKMIHRDVKPGNTMINKHGRIKLIDFDLAVMGPKSRGASGTTSYSAPEVWIARPRSNYGYEVDYYSLGVIAYELIFNILPFKYMEQFLKVSETQPAKRKAVEIAVKTKSKIKYPKTLDAITMDFLSGCLKKNPTLRLGKETYLEHPYFASIHGQP